MYLGIIAFVFSFIFAILGAAFFGTGFGKIVPEDPTTIFAWIDSGSAILLCIAFFVVLAISIFGIVYSCKLRKTNERKQGTISLGFSIASTALSGLLWLLFGSISIFLNIVSSI